MSTGARLMLVGLLTALIGGGTWLSSYLGALDHDNMQPLNALADVNDRMAGRPRDPAKLQRGADVYRAREITSYVLIGVGMLFLAVGWATLPKGDQSGVKSPPSNES